MAGRERLEVVKLADLADRSLPLGKVFPPDSASLWRNSQASYPESEEMYARMLGISQRLAAAEANAESDPDYLEAAREDLYRGQCGSAYRHDRSGGLSQPHLRHAVYRHLIAADNALDEIEGKSGPRVRSLVGDFNLDARQEVRLENDHLIAFVRPAQGGHLYELDVREQLTNVLATLDCPMEAGRAPVVAGNAAGGQRPCSGRTRKALVDHFYPVEASIDQLAGYRDLELGDFAIGTFQAKLRREPHRVALIMDRAGRSGKWSMRVRKTISLAAGESVLAVGYEINEIPQDACLHFAVEINVAGTGGGARRDCHYTSLDGTRLGANDATLDLPHTRGVCVTNESSDLSVTLSWSQSAGLWCFPIETASEGMSGTEGVHQSSRRDPALARHCG